jgi:DHA1 family tetracycline resistance protein-like MFS transporter
MEDRETTGFFRTTPLYVVIFIGFLGYSLTITILTPMILNDSGGMLASLPLKADRLIVLGLVLALYPLGQFFGSPVLGSLSDRFGRRPVLLISLLISTVCYGVFAYALMVRNLPLFMIVSFVIGLSEANIAIAQSAIADLSTARNRTRLFAYINLSASSAFVIGPLAGGILADQNIIRWFSYDTPYWAVCFLLFCTLIFTATVFSETRPPDSRRVVRYREAITNLLTVFARGKLRAVYLVNFLIYFAIFGFFRSFPMYLVDEYGMGVSQVSKFIAWNALPVVLASLWLAGYLANHYSPRSITAYSSILFGVSALLVIIPEPVSALWVTLFLPGLALAVALPACTAMLSLMVGGAEQGKVLGNNLSLEVGAEVLSGLAAGFLAAYMIELPMGIVAAVAITAGLILVLVNGKGGDTNP